MITKEQLAAYGVNVEETMERFIDDMELYETCLNEFLNEPAFDELKKALDEGDNNAAFNAAHTLKGVTGNLGLTPLYKSVCALVEPLRKGDGSNSAALYQNIMSEREKVEKLVKGC